MGNRFSVGSLARELASRGCIIYTLDHDDGTCSASYSRELNGFWVYEDIFFYLDDKIAQTECKNRVRNIRV